MGGWPAHLSRGIDRRFSQFFHDHGPAKPVGALEYAGVDRAACGMGRRLHRHDEQNRKGDNRGDARGEEEWGAHVNEIVNGTLMPRANSWYRSANFAGKPRAFLPYLGPEGVGGYRRKCDEVAAKDYDGFTLA